MASNNRQQRAGEVINLRARFKDDAGDPAEATDVYIHIFDSDATDLDDLSQANTVSGVPTYLGQGIYEYQFTIPSVGPDGTWYDTWQGNLTGQELEATLSFDVIASGYIESLPETQLWDNNLITVTIASGVQALSDTTTLQSEYSFEFYTTASPLYSDVRKVKLRAGGYLSDIDDYVIILNLLEASIEADILSFGTTINSDLYQHARREYVTCLAALMLIENTYTTVLKSKSLDNFHVEYDTVGIRQTQDRLEECASKWENQILAGGGYVNQTAPRMTVKGTYDPDRPVVGRLWWSEEDGVVQKTPAVNTRYKKDGYRRAKKVRKKRYW